jgi:hypothetical protein
MAATREDVQMEFAKVMEQLPDEVFRSAVANTLAHVFSIYNFPQPDGSIDCYFIKESGAAAKGH